VARASPINRASTAASSRRGWKGASTSRSTATACKLLEGFIPLIQGPAQRRGGFRYVGEVKDSTKRTWLVRFEFNTTQAYQLEFGDRYIRFWANHGQVVVSGVAAYNNATAYSIGDLATSGGVTYYCIAATTGNAPPNATYWYALTGSIYEIPSPYTTADLTNADGTFALRVVQSADVIYIAHSAYAPRKLSRLGATDWTLQTVTFAGGPFKTRTSPRRRSTRAPRPAP
jgi:hypothetical protein